MNNYKEIKSPKLSCCQRFLQKINCCFTKKKQTQTHLANNKLDSPFTFYGMPGSLCAAKITLHNFLLIKQGQKINKSAKDIHSIFLNRQSLTSEQLKELKPYIFPYQHELIITDEQLKSVLPFCVTQYLAKRITQFTKDIIVDVITGAGTLSIEIAQLNVNQVDSYSIDQNDNAKYNIQQFHYSSLQKQNIYISSFFERQEKSAAIIIQYQFINNDQLDSQLDQYLIKAFELSENIVIILPSNIQVNDICSFLSRFQHNNFHSLRQLEIQKINIGGLPLCQIVYLGFIQDEEIIEQQLRLCFLKELLKDRTNMEEQQISNYQKVLNQVITQIGMFSTMLLIQKTLESNTQVDFISDLFFQQIFQLNIIPQENIRNQLEYSFVDQTPTLNHPLLQCSQSSQSKKQSSLRISTDLSRLTLNQSKYKIFSFQNKTIE